MSIKLYGRIPSKKNSKIMICRGGRPILIPSPAYSTWHEEQMWVLKDHKIRKQVPKKVNSIQLDFYAPDSRKTDLTNKAESIMDLLVDANLILDDNWYVVPCIILKFIEVDKKNPRVEITFN